MTEIHFNEATDLRITKVEQFIPGRRYLMVHNRPENDTYTYPPYCSEVWATGVERTSFYDIMTRSLPSYHKDEHSLALRWFLFRTGDVDANYAGELQYECAADHGFTDSEPVGHAWNFILDLDDLESRGITILREVSPDTNMSQDRDPVADYLEDRLYGMRY